MCYSSYAKRKMRNIVLITIDDLRAANCSFMGYKRKTTPTLDKMAEEGLYFKNAIAPGPNTPSSMKAIFTGRYLEVDTGFGIINLLRDKIIREISREQTLAQVLSEKGYSTAAFTPTAYASSYFGFDKGFNYFQDFIFKSRESILSNLYRKIFQKFNKGEQIAFILRSFLDFIQDNGAFMHWEKYYEDIIEWVENVQEPFFLWCFPLDTHYPYTAPKEFRKWSNFLDMYLFNFYYCWKITKTRGKLNFSEKERKRLINAYDDSIYYVDSFVKRLWNDLKHLDPIFIIHADHGEAFGEHGFYAHPAYLYEELIHVPLIIYNAGLKGEIEKPVSLLSLAPTILELIGEKNQFPSKSFLNNGEDIIISKAYNGERKIAVRIGDWKYIEGQKEGGELFNLREDPNERENLIGEYPELAKEMKNIVKVHIRHEEEKRKIRERIQRIII